MHWYDQTGLLKPAYIGANGYRYYEEEQLLRLQQILFFRELGFNLDDIQKMLMQTDFDKISVLTSHKQILSENISRIKKLINTIDNTILHLRGTHNMKDKEFYAGFDSQKQKEYEQYLVKSYGTVAEKLICESKKNTSGWGSKEYADIECESNAIYKALAECIDKGLAPKADEVQVIIDKHYQIMERFYHPSKDVYTGLAQLYCEHPDFRKFFDVHHPKLVEFISEAMRVYAQKNL